MITLVTFDVMTQNLRDMPLHGLSCKFNKYCGTKPENQFFCRGNMLNIPRLSGVYDCLSFMPGVKQA